MNNPRAKIKRKEYIKQNIPLCLMAFPAMAILIAFCYLPMFGLILAFKDFSYRAGILGSDWIGLKNFDYVFGSGEIFRTLGNTIGYHIAFTVTITCSGILLSVLLFFIRGKFAQKVFQTSTIVPYMVSYTVIAYIVFILLSSENGIINQVMLNMSMEKVSWYTEPTFWPVILVICNMWFGVGIKAVYYYASLMAIDQSLFEAAELDGARRWHEVFHIMLPSIAPTVCIFLILDLGNILSSSLELFYAVPMDSTALYGVTDVLATYTYRGLMSGDIGTTTALGLFTGVVTTVMTLAVNGVVKKISPENSLL